MEEECGVSTCKKVNTTQHSSKLIQESNKISKKNQYISSQCNVYNNIGKYCHCAHKIFSLKEQCNRFNYTEKCVSHDSIKKKIPCNAVTCKAHRKLHFHKKASPTEGWHQYH